VERPGRTLVAFRAGEPSQEGRVLLGNGLPRRRLVRYQLSGLAPNTGWIASGSASELKDRCGCGDRVPGLVRPGRRGRQKASESPDTRGNRWRAGCQSEVEDAALRHAPVAEDQHVCAARGVDEVSDGCVTQVR
jgi:hypothetical protein